MKHKWTAERRRPNSLDTIYIRNTEYSWFDCLIPTPQVRSCLFLVGPSCCFPDCINSTALSKERWQQVIGGSRPNEALANNWTMYQSLKVAAVENRNQFKQSRPFQSFTTRKIKLRGRCDQLVPGIENDWMMFLRFLLMYGFIWFWQAGNRMPVGQKVVHQAYRFC